LSLAAFATVYLSSTSSIRPSREPLELIDEIEKEFNLATYPVNWPIGTGDQFKGVVDRQSQTVYLFERTVGGRTRGEVATYKLDDPKLKELIPKALYAQLNEELEILDAAAAPLDLEKIHQRRAYACLFWQRYEQLRY
jgi:peptide chain release factor 3